jgi:hypothetical protein
MSGCHGQTLFSTRTSTHGVVFGVKNFPTPLTRRSRRIAALGGVRAPPLALRKQVTSTHGAVQTPRTRQATDPPLCLSCWSPGLHILQGALVQEMCLRAGAECRFISGVPSGQEYSRLFIAPPRALGVARRFFGCPSLQKLEMEDGGSSGSRGSHWDQTFFMQAIIAASSSYNSVFAEASFALFEDTGWYRAANEAAGFR